ncbi:MAG: hypothetical protein J6Y84_04325 [Bacteroidaceae bacterium]|nr:hypothetical protein [Bacteroidaceae bacterium]
MKRTISRPVLKMVHSSRGKKNEIGKKRKLFYYAEDVASHIDCVFISEDDYKEIFGKERKDMNRSKKALSVIKVSYKANGIKRSVHRRFDTVSAFNTYEKKYAALSHTTLQELTMDDPDKLRGEIVELSKGNTFKYYWRNPIAATRSSFRLGFISICLGALSLGITLFPDRGFCGVLIPLLIITGIASYISLY